MSEFTDKLRNEYLDANNGKVALAASALGYNFTLDDPRIFKQGYSIEAALLVVENFFPEVKVAETRLIVRVGIEVLRETRGTTVEENEKEARYA